MKAPSLKFLLILLTVLGIVLVVQNAVMLVHLHWANGHLRAIRDASESMHGDLQHVKEDVESNSEAIENLTAMVEEAMEGK
jgi:hypothetical protein